MKIYNSFSYLAVTAVAFGLVSCSKPPSRTEGASGAGYSAPEIPGDPGDPLNPKDDDLIPNVAKDTDGDGIPDEAVPPVSLAFTSAFPRLTHAQWENAVRDVLLLDATPNLSATFTSDPGGSGFFKTDGNFLKVSATLWQEYQTAAETLANNVVASSSQVGKLIPPGTPPNGAERTKTIVSAIGKRAFRRPLTATELNRLSGLYDKAPGLTGKKDSTQSGLQVIIQALLQSPHFLYRTELGQEKTDLTTLTPYEIASRLSFTAWNTIPDAELLEAAESGALSTEAGLRKQAQRLIDDPKADATLVNFYEKIFDTAGYADAKKDTAAFPAWSDDMPKLLVQEADLFIKEAVLKQNGGVSEVLTAPYTFVTSKTAPLYGLTASSETMTKVTLNETQRAGILTQLGFLSRRSKQKVTDPIHRGVVTAVDVLCAELGNAPPVTVVIPEASGVLTTRDLVEKNTGKGTCGQSCHGGIINPAGYAFENYDAMGKWRTTDNNLPVNAVSEFKFPEGSIQFNNAVEFMKKAVVRSEVHECFIKKAMELAYGRKVEKQDASLISVVAAKSEKKLSTRELFLELMIDSRVSIRGNKGE